MYQKRGQITIFLVVGLLLLIIVGMIYFVLQSLGGDKTVDIPFERSSIETYITGCLKSTAEEAIYTLGKQGGYLNPQEHLKSDNYDISYLYDKGANKVPKKDVVELQLESEIDAQMLNCVENFQSFQEQGWQVSFEAPQSEVQLNEKDVSIEQTFLISIEKDEVINFQQFTTTLDIRLAHLLTIADEIVAFHQQEPEWTDLTALSRLDVDITVFPYKQTLMYSLNDPASSIRTQEYLFNFATRFE